VGVNEGVTVFVGVEVGVREGVKVGVECEHRPVIGLGRERHVWGIQCLGQRGDGRPELGELCQSEWSVGESQ